MPSDARAVVTASLAADALALGAHWIYDTGQIDAAFGRVEALQDPLPSSFHAGKGRGDLTHYGDQTLLLLRSLVEEAGFSLDGFARAWRGMFGDYTGYRDHASQDTLKRFEDGWPPEDAGSASTDLGGAARIAPLVFFYHDDEEQLLTAVRQQTAMTHQNALVVDSAAFWARVAVSVLQGQTPLEAVQAIGSRFFDRPPFAEWVSKGVASRDTATRQAIAEFGPACGVDQAFPSVVHLIAKYQKAAREGMIANVMAGGDSAARGLIAGMVLGAHMGTAAVSEDWLKGMHCLQAVEKDLNTLAERRGTR
jgi:ADP-ribosylglycohydrolase